MTTSCIVIIPTEAWHISCHTSCNIVLGVLVGKLYIKTHLMFCFSLSSSLCRIWWPKCEPCLPPPRPSSLPILKKDVAFFWMWQLCLQASGILRFPGDLSGPQLFQSPLFIHDLSVHQELSIDSFSLIVLRLVPSRKCEVRWSETWAPGFTAGVRKPLIRQEIKSQLCFWCTENQMWNNVCLLFWDAFLLRVTLCSISCRKSGSSPSMKAYVLII